MHPCQERPFRCKRTIPGTEFGDNRRSLLETQLILRVGLLWRVKPKEKFQKGDGGGEGAKEVSKEAKSRIDARLFTTPSGRCSMEIHELGPPIKHKA